MFHNSTMTYTFTVRGTPAPQGSKTRTRWGMKEASSKLMPWREAIVSQIMREGHDGLGLTGPIHVRATFIFPRPKNHYGSRNGEPYLKDSAPWWKPSDPDLDKLQRSLGDALAQSGMIADDNQIVMWESIKRYAIVNEHEGVQVEMGEM